MDDGGGFLGVVGSLMYLAVLLLVVVSSWKIFEKAGKPGWAAIVPIYNLVVLLEIVRKPLWWILLLLIPLVNLVIGLMLSLELAKRFGKSSGFGVGLILLPFVFYPMLAFGDATYQP